MNRLWTAPEDGTAQGPIAYVDTPGGGWTLQALWSDEDGVVVSFHIEGDGILDLESLGQMRAAVDQMLALEPPVTITQKEAK